MAGFNARNPAIIMLFWLVKYESATMNKSNHLRRLHGILVACLFLLYGLRCIDGKVGFVSILIASVSFEIIHCGFINQVAFECEERRN